MSNGHVIWNTCIAVDYWTPGKVSEHCLRPLKVNEEVIIENPYTKDTFSVTLIDARHCPGAVMYYFQGSFGNILYTGDFRYDEQMRKDPILQSIIRKQAVNVLYMDNTYASPKCAFPSREEAMEEILDIIRRHPNSRIYLGLRMLGKEEILSNIYTKLKEKVHVNKNRMKLLITLNLQNCMCTNEPNESRIFVIHFNMLTSAWIENRRREGIDCIGIKPTAFFMCLNSATRNLSSSGLYVVPYSDHSSSKELSDFVSDVKPEQLFPIVSNTKHLNSEHNSKKLSKIPDFIYDLCKRHTIDCSNRVCQKYQQCRCDQFSPKGNITKSFSQNCSDKSRQTLNSLRLQNGGNYVGLTSRWKINEYIPHTKLQPHYSDLKKGVSESEVEVISDTRLLETEKVKQLRLRKKTLKQNLNSQGDIRNDIIHMSATSHNCVTQSLHLNAVQKCSNSEAKQSQMSTKLAACKMSQSKVGTTQFHDSRLKPCKYNKFILLYSEDAKETSAEHNQIVDYSKQHPDFKKSKSNYVDTHTIKIQKDEKEKIIQKQRPHKVSESCITDNQSSFLGIQTTGTKEIYSYKESDSSFAINRTGKYVAEPQKKRAKISKKLDL